MLYNIFRAKRLRGNSFEVKYLRSIELIADYRSLGEGQGGSREDIMFYGRRAEI